MPANLKVESTLTDRFQTTVPQSVRRALRLNKRDKIHFTIRPDDAYRVFCRMLDSGRPPSDWSQLLTEAQAVSQRLARLGERKRP